MVKIPSEVLTVLPEMDGLSVLEFGNKKNSSGLFGDYYRTRCGAAEYTSVDWNGLDGAIKLDAMQDLSHLGTFDVVTSFGFNEHVDEQPPFWENVHNLTAPGGMMIGLTPNAGDPGWHNHGVWHCGIEFLQQLAEENDYDPIVLDVVQPDGFREGKRVVHWCMQKPEEERQFVMPQYRFTPNKRGKRQGPNV